MFILPTPKLDSCCKVYTEQKKHGCVTMKQMRKIRRDAYVFNATVATRICFVSRCTTN